MKTNKIVYGIFTRKNPFDFYFLLLEDFPQEERTMIENHLCSGGDLVLSDNFFEVFHDGRTFPFRGRTPKFFGVLKINDAGKIYEPQSIRYWWIILSDIIQAFEKQTTKTIKYENKLCYFFSR
ncbi:MAG: hypothetical protein WCH65_01180 [bacterium]